MSLREYIDLTYMLHTKFNWKDSYKMLCIRTVTIVCSLCKTVSLHIHKIFILQSCSQFYYHHHHQLIFLIIITLVVVPKCILFSYLEAMAYFPLSPKPFLWRNTFDPMRFHSMCFFSFFCHHASHSPHGHAPYFRTWWMLSCAFSHC